MRIGFAQKEYTYYEPDFDETIMNVTLIKEANQLTEQLYSVAITISPTGVNPATSESFSEAGDYSFGDPEVNYRQLPLHSGRQEVPLVFILFCDFIAEGTEAFQATISTVEGTPTFRDPTVASLSTTIRIIDNDCT